MTLPANPPFEWEDLTLDFDAIDDTLKTHTTEIATNTAAIAAMQTLQPVQAFSYLNSWRPYQGSSAWSSINGYYKDAFGIVHFQGLLDKNGGSWVPSEQITSVPVGYIPNENLIFSGATAGLTPPTNNFVEVRVNTDGSVTLGGYGAPSNPVGYLSLSDIHYRAS